MFKLRPFVLFPCCSTETRIGAFQGQERASRKAQSKMVNLTGDSDVLKRGLKQWEIKKMQTRSVSSFQDLTLPCGEKRHVVTHLYASENFPGLSESLPVQEGVGTIGVKSSHLSALGSVLSLA